MFCTETGLNKFLEKSATSIQRTEETQDGGSESLRKIATRGSTSWKTVILISDLRFRSLVHKNMWACAVYYF